MGPRVKEVKEEGGEELQVEMKREEEEEACPWVADYDLLLCEGLFGEYLEMGEWIYAPGAPGWVVLTLRCGVTAPPPPPPAPHPPLPPQ